jgi:hypothetical protein
MSLTLKTDCKLLIDIISIYGKPFQCIVYNNAPQLTYQKLLNTFQQQTGYSVSKFKEGTKNKFEPLQLFVMDPYNNIITRANITINTPPDAQHLILYVATIDKNIDEDSVYRKIKDYTFVKDTCQTDMDCNMKTQLTFNYFIPDKTVYDCPDIKQKTYTSQPFQIFVRGVNNKIITLNNVYPETTGFELKVLIENKSGIQTNHQRITYENHQIQNEDEVQKYQVTKDSTLHFSLRLRGGMFHESSGRNHTYGNTQETYFIYE